MRVLRLTLEGFGPFAERYTIEFSEFADTGVYLIGGPTGAGKSTILDAIVFALFGSVPRYEGVSAKRSNLRSDFAIATSPTHVELTFETQGTVYRVRRSPEYLRPKQRGDGFTTSKASVALDIASGDGWETLSTSYVDAGNRIREIVGLTAEQFQQTTLLAQGRFAEFLQANSDTRADILRRLFRTERFGALTSAIADEAREATARTERIDEEIAASSQRAVAALGELTVDQNAAPLPDAFESISEVREAGLAVLERQRTRVEATREARDAALKNLGEARTLHSDIRERDEALRERAALEAEEKDVAASRGQLSRALWALDLWSFVTAKDAAHKVLEERVSALEAASSAAGSNNDLNDADLQDRIEQLREHAAKLKELLTIELSLPDLRAAVVSLDERKQQEERQRDGLRTRLEELPARLDALQEEIQRLRDHAGELESKRSAVASVEERAKTLQATRESEQRHTELEGRLRRAMETKRVAAERADQLLRALLDGTAVRLALTLEPGSPCPVCGALEHPHPAGGSDDQTVVTEEAVDEARAHEQEATEALDRARSAEREEHARMSALQEQCGDDDEMRLEHALTEATAALDVAVRAAEKLPERLAEHARIVEEQASLRAAIERAGEDIAASVTAHALAREELERAEQDIRSAVADETTVAEQQETTSSELRLAQDLADARLRLADAREAATSAAEELDGVLDGATEAELRAAYLDRDAREALEERVRVFDAASARTRATLERAAIQSIDERSKDGLPDLGELERIAEQAEQLHAEHVGSVAKTESVLAAVKREQDATERLQQELSAMGDRTRALSRLAQSLDGKGPNVQRMRLETYVLAAGLEAILDAANDRLSAMTQGRYRLEHDDSGEDRGRRGGLGIVVRDDYTGATRSVQSLSGGETFLTSLALALGLADIVQAEAGGVQLDTLFIDEGFGALDAGVLELAMQVLSDLQTGGRSIGVISHVPSMQERIPERIRVVRAAGGRGSRIEFP